MSKLCNSCSAEYEPTGRNQKHCASCRPKMDSIKARLSAKRYMESHRAEAIARSKLWKYKNPERYKANNIKHAEARRKPGARRNGKVDPVYPWASQLLYEARSSSKERGHPPPAISAEWVIEKFKSQEERCYWTGVPMDSGDRNLQPSLDRLDNNLGYYSDNVVITTWFSNRARSDIPVFDFVKLIHLIHENAPHAHPI